MDVQHYAAGVRSACVSYAHYLEGKSVALVGRAGYIFDSPVGEFIDSHDVVVRINSLRPHVGLEATFTKEERQRDQDLMPPDAERAFGSRTSIIYTIYTWKHIARQFTKVNGKFVVGVRLPNSQTPEHELDAPFPILPYPWDMRKRLKRKVGSLAFTGTLAFDHLLSFNVKSVYLTGFTCYHDVPTAWIHGHHGVNDLLYMRRLATNDPRVTTDEYMSNLFKKYADHD